MSKRNVFLPVNILKLTFASFKKNRFTLKTNILKYFSIVGFLLFLIACSTKKNTFLSRNSHALSTKYNILYNGGIALDKGVVDLKTQYKDNFWEFLPIERMQVNKEATLPGQATPNPNFDRAETKATKAIQKHSMNIAGSEKNPQMDEAHLMLGKARYYDQRFIPALEAFNYILYKYPNSDRIYEAKIWREKVNIRLDNDAIAVENLNKLLKEIKFKNQIFADANAILSQAFLNLGEKDSAIVKLKLAKEFTKSKEEKALYYYILGQLYEELGYKDSAYISYQSIIDMKRKAAKPYVIHAHLRQATQFDCEKGDTIAYLKKFNGLLKDRENRPFLDFLNHQMGLFYDAKKNYPQAKKHYNISLKSKATDQYLIASNYRNLAEIFFKNNKYVTAGKYYDSTLVQMNARTREYKFIKKKRENLVDVIKYEGIATRNDSILSIYSLPDADKLGYYQEYIDKLKKDNELKKQKEALAKSKEDAGKSEGDVSGKSINGNDETESKKSAKPTPKNGNLASSSGDSKFYFYNPTTVAFGIAEFKKRWGNRTYKINWRVSDSKESANPNQEDVADDDQKDADKKADNKDAIEQKYTTDFYLKQLPKSQKEADSIAKERNFAYYQLGVIYKEKFKEYKLAATKLEKLLENNPEERLVLPSMYNLFKIYEIIDKDKALVMKNRIISQYPDSRYAQILGNTSGSSLTFTDTPEANYSKLYKLYETGEYKTVLTDLNAAIDQYTGEELVSKYELLKANTIGKLKGIGEFKKALNFVALNYPNSEEGKKAEALLSSDIPQLESLKFYQAKPLSWKILYKSNNPEDKGTKTVQDKIKKFITDRGMTKITMSYDIYTMDKNFVVIHGLKTEEYAKGIASILKEFKEYKIPDVGYVISNDNYKIVQIKKNFEEYLTTPPSEPLPAKVYVPAPQPKVLPPAGNDTPKPDVDGKDPLPNMNQLPPQMPGSPAPNIEDQKAMQKEKR